MMGPTLTIYSYLHSRGAADLVISATEIPHQPYISMTLIGSVQWAIQILNLGGREHQFFICIERGSWIIHSLYPVSKCYKCKLGIKHNFINKDPMTHQ